MKDTSVVSGRSRVLYITRNGLLEPLGQSQVLAYLRGLAVDYRITLVSCEKPEDLANHDMMARVREECERCGIAWLPQRFVHKPRFLAPAWSMAVFLYMCLREVRRGNADLIHARAYIPSAVALLVHKLTGTPFIFDMRALWPEELITAGRMKRNSLIHKMMIKVERACLKRAAAVVSLTQAAVDYLKKQYPAELESQYIVVNPTCADLQRFVPLPHAGAADRVPVYGCLGTVLSGWFKLDWLAAFYQAVARRYPEAEFEIVTRDDVAAVRTAMGGDDDFQARLRVFPAASQDVHKVVQKHYLSAMFFSQGLSKVGSSPTRMGEMLGCGIPVIANAGVGDVALIIERYRVGVLVDSCDTAAMETALDQMELLTADPDLPSRCRRAAEEVFSLASGTEVYRDVYRRILQGVEPA